jgi:superfamily II DNA or RNA helicase
MNMSDTKTRKKLEPWDYQLEGVEKFEQWWTSPEMEALIALTMGMGKTITAACCVTRFLEKINPKGRILWLTHREELIEQSKLELEIYTGQYCEIEKASQRFTGLAQIIVASVQTLRGKRLQRLAEDFQPDLIICDEAHHALALTWMQVKQTFPKAKVLNLTATPFRSDIGNRLELGTVLLEKNTTDGIRMGVLVPPKPIGKMEINLGTIKKRLGDYDVASLAELLCRDEIVKGCLELIDKNCRGHKSILFAASVDHGKLLAENLRKIGFRVGEVYGTTPTEERKGYYAGVRAGTIDILVNNLCLSEGFNLPALDIAIMLRPTRNAALYLQAIGRVLRKDPNNPAKTHGYIIDIIDTAKRRGGEECPLPTDDDVRMYSALQGRSACQTEVFLGWFYKAAELADLVAGVKKVNELTKLDNADRIYKLLAPPWMAQLDVNPAAAILGIIWTPEGDYKNLLKPFRIGSPDAFRLLLGRKGWIYLPHNKLPQTDDQLAEYEVGAAPADAESNYTLTTLISQDAQLRNFIMDLFDPNQSLKEQASKCYDRFPLGESGFEVAWFKVIHKVDARFYFIQWKEGDTNHILARTVDGKIYSFQQLGRNRLDHQPGLELRHSFIPDFVKGVAWANKSMSAKQAIHVAKILDVTVGDAQGMHISSLSASALMSNQWNKAHLKNIGKQLSEPENLVPVEYMDDVVPLMQVDLEPTAIPAGLP